MKLFRLILLGSVQRDGVKDRQGGASANLRVSETKANMEAALGKVTAFITRATENGRELLVFLHPTAGLQVPAGTVEAGETPEAAVLRETAEETGLHGVSIVERLAVIPQALADDEWMVTERCVLQASPGTEGTLRLGGFLQRGQTVQVIDHNGGFQRVTFNEHKLEDDSFVAVSSQTGWVPSRCLTRSVQRSLFHLTPTEPTPQQWAVDADGHTFALFWISLDQPAGLIAPQQAWLDLVHDRL